MVQFYLARRPRLARSPDPTRPRPVPLPSSCFGGVFSKELGRPKGLASTESDHGLARVYLENGDAFRASRARAYIRAVEERALTPIF